MICTRCAMSPSECCLSLWCRHYPTEPPELNGWPRRIFSSSISAAIPAPDPKVPGQGGEDGRVTAVPRSWCEAWADAATGPAGFWRRSSPAAHFRTASTLGPELAEAVLSLLAGHPQVSAVLEV